jgi:drug/metabolite transporter (DMT)-like permease
MCRYAGEIAALATAFTWAISAVCWTAAGERVGSLVVNTLRLFIAFPIFLVYGHFVLGEAIPFSASPAAWLWLGISGVTGFFICDLCLFRSFLLIGTRRAMLIFALAPLATSLFGWIVLHECLSVLNMTGMFVAISGVIWVVVESPDPHSGSARQYKFSKWGAFLAFTAMLMQAVSSIVSKIGLAYLPSPVAATEIRLIAGMICFAVLMLFLKRYPAFIPALRSFRTMGILLTGAIAGPCFGVALLMFALQKTSAGLAMTFVSLTPVFVIPFTMILFKERISLRAVAGAIVAFIGLALLFVR